MALTDAKRLEAARDLAKELFDGGRDATAKAEVS